MGDKPTPTIFAERDLWARVFKRLTLWTMGKHRVNAADAEEMVQEAIRLFLSAGGVADPTNSRDLFMAIGSGVNGVAVNMRRKKARRAVTLTEDGEALHKFPDATEGIEQRLLNDAQARQRLSALLERLQGDDIATAVLLLMADGVSDAASQAKALGLPVAEVYNARRRIASHAKALTKLVESE